MKKLIYPLLAILFLACGQQNIAVKKYYFPYSKFVNSPAVYKYKNSMDSSYMYWCLRTEVQNSDTILGIHIFNTDCKLTNIIFNQITSEGVRLKKMLSFNGDNNQNVNYQINKDEVADWVIQPAEKLYVSLEFQDSIGAMHQVLIEKIFTRKKDNIDFMNKNYSCILIQELYTNSLQTQNRTRSELEQRNCYYAEGLGLIRVDVIMSDSSKNTITLESIMDFKEWEDLRISKTDTSQVINN